MMYQSDAEILFPARVIPFLRNLRGQVWKQLIDYVLEQQAGSIEEQAFCLMMIRLDGCLTCHADSYRAMRGCTLCAQQTITRFKGSDQELVDMHNQAKTDLIEWQQSGVIPLSERLPPEMELE
ncbi:MAG: hypothetical protein JXB30_10030 [Anaerolineae bacterium]|nr:hypothetical protein [Anaerolineae bacterium]